MDKYQGICASLRNRSLLLYLYFYLLVGQDLQIKNGRQHKVQRVHRITGINRRWTPLYYDEHISSFCESSRIRILPLHVLLHPPARLLAVAIQKRDVYKAKQGRYHKNHSTLGASTVQYIYTYIHGLCWVQLKAYRARHS